MKNTKKQVFGIIGLGHEGQHLGRILADKAVGRKMNVVDSNSEVNKSILARGTGKPLILRKDIKGSNGNSIDYLVFDDFHKEMRSNNKHMNKNLLLADLALLLIEATQPRSEAAKAISHQRSMVVKRWGGAFQEVTELRTIMEVLVKKLVACEDTAMIAHTLSAIQAINTGDMLIADDEQIIQ